jgi:hypothetical protein
MPFRGLPKQYLAKTHKYGSLAGTSAVAKVGRAHEIRLSEQSQMAPLTTQAHHAKLLDFECRSHQAPEAMSMSPEKSLPLILTRKL